MRSKAKLMLGNPSDHVDFNRIENALGTSHQPSQKPSVVQTVPDEINKQASEVASSVSKKKSFNEESVRISGERFEYENELSIGPRGIDREKTPLSTQYVDSSIFEFPTNLNCTTSAVGQPQETTTSPVMGDDNLNSMTGLIRYEELSGFVKLGSGSSASVFKVYHTPSSEITFGVTPQLTSSSSQGELDSEDSVKEDNKKPNRQVYAMKKIYVEKQLAKSIIHEVKALYTNRNPHIIKLLDSFYREGAILMILEYMDCGSLEDVIKITKKVPEKILSKMTYQILKGLKYIHEECYIIHRDIKPANILINSKGICKIADFGMSGFWIKSKLEEIQKTAKFDTFCGTYSKFIPERIRGQSHSFDSDIWSLGLTIAQLGMGIFPFTLKPEFTIWSMFEHLEETGSEPFPIDEKEYSPEFKSFVYQCMTFDRKKRPSASQLMNHPWITKYKKDEEKMRKSVEKWVYRRYIAVKRHNVKQKQKEASSSSSSQEQQPPSSSSKR
ncbi:hypothetical protein C9374_002462 [Naegleria lovaniensis]|uniref:mitogen-activated protein kinase kinase n=1 Tax=Naegleria lovaniensis TaxID=51637 RepID=A0AA88GUT7_NAELO|nr:uncharacterized protein C9374_002462 [Naegleria lovaniensis]KAG2386718.1 hypothetical protein C9374_002462 [Naegleria lovaniensis]